MNTNLHSDDHDLRGEYPKAVSKVAQDGQTYYGMQFGSDGTTVTIWYKSVGERQMAMETAALIAAAAR